MKGNFPPSEGLGSKKAQVEQRNLAKKPADGQWWDPLSVKSNNNSNAGCWIPDVHGSSCESVVNERERS